jgi:hypothetical protein
MELRNAGKPGGRYAVGPSYGANASAYPLPDAIERA